MIKAGKIHPIHVELTLDELNVVLDALYALHETIRTNPTYTIPEKLYAHSQTQGVLGAFAGIYTLIIGEGHQTVPRYHLETADITVTQTQPG